VATLHLKWTFEDLLQAYCYAIKASCRTIPSHISPLASASRVANLAFLSQILKFWLFLTPLAFFGNQKSKTKSGFFQSERLGSGKALSELHIYYKSLLKRVYNRAGCTKYWKDFTLALKMIDAIDKKHMYDSVVTGKENASEEWNCIISMYLKSFNIYFLFGYAYFMRRLYASKLLSGFFWDKVWLFWRRQVRNPVCWQMSGHES